MQVGGQYRQGDGAGEAVGAVSADTVEPPMLQSIDGRFNRRMRAPRGGEGFLRFAFPVHSGPIPLSRQRVEVEERVEMDPVFRTVKAPVEAARPQIGIPRLGFPDPSAPPRPRPRPPTGSGGAG